MIKIKLNENLLNEEVIGAQAFVYHGSKTPPRQFIPYFSDDKFLPGFGAGGMYGSGLYTVYNFLNTKTSRGDYGQFIYKFKVNLYGFIIFNMNIAEKVYGKRLTPANQAILIGKNELASDLYDAYNDHNTSKLTSEYALKAAKFLEGKVKGIVFTGGNDGDVAVIYDASIATLVSYLNLSRQDKEDFSWQRIDASIVKNQIKNNIEDKFKNDKYKYKQDFNETEFHHSVRVSGKEAKQIKEGSIFHRDLMIANASDVDIPKNIKVKRTLRLDTCWTSKIPDGIEVDKLELYNCKKLRELSNIKINGEISIYQCPDLISISMEQLNLRGGFYIYGCPKLQTIPNKIVIENGDVNIIDCLNLRKLPDHLECSGLYINDDETKLELPQVLHLNRKDVSSYLTGSDPIIRPSRLWDEFIEKIKKSDIPQYNRLSKLYGKFLENIVGNYSYLDESLIAEMPIKNYQTIGNFEKPGAFKGPDQRMMNHPGYIRKLERFFSRSRYDMNFWMSHKPGMRKEREQGIISPEKLRKLFPKEADAILKDHEDAITIIFLGNFGDNKVMMTPWIVAHRMGHAFSASNRYNKKSTSGHLWKELEESIFEEIHSIMKDKYGLLPYHPLNRYRPELNDTYRQIFEAIGTSKSARDENLPRPYEFIYECLAQFIMTGEIKFNPMPQRIGSGKKTFGKYQSFFRWNGTDEERKEFADDLADLMTWRMDEILSGSLNDIFLM